MKRHAFSAAAFSGALLGAAMFSAPAARVPCFMFFAVAVLTALVPFAIFRSSTLVLARLAQRLLAPVIMELITRTPRGRALLERWGSAPAFEEASANGGLAPSESPAS